MCYYARAGSKKILIYTINRVMGNEAGLLYKTAVINV